MYDRTPSFSSRSFWLLKRIAASNLGLLQQPYKLTLALTYRCNQRCTACQIWRREPVDELTVQELDRFFTTSSYFSWIDLTGGEIFLRSDLADLLDSLLARLPRLCLLHFPTNGYLTQRIVDIVARLTRTYDRLPKIIITVSVDGPEAINDRLRGTPGAWRRSVETYLALKSLPGVSVYFGMTVTKHNSHKIDATHEALAKRCPGLRHNDLHLNVGHSSELFFSNEEVDLLGDRETRAQIATEIDRALKRRWPPLSPVTYLDDRFLRLAGQYLRAGTIPFHCQAITTSCFVDPAGVVFPCTIWGKSLGHLRQTGFDLRPALRSEEARRLLPLIRSRRCPRCWTPCEAYQTMLAHLPRLFL